MAARKKLVILAAVNGGAQQDRDGAHVPITPAEIAEAAHQCYKAGASVVHVHARAADKGPTSDLKVFSDIIKRIRDKCDILIQTTNGFGVRRDPRTNEYVWPNDEERLALHSVEPKQDLFSIAAGSWDFYHPEGGYPGTVSYMNSEHLLQQNIKAVLKRGASLEFEITEVSQIHKLKRFAEEGVFDRNTKNLWLDYCLGFRRHGSDRAHAGACRGGRSAIVSALEMGSAGHRARPIPNEHRRCSYGLRYRSCRL